MLNAHVTPEPYILGDELTTYECLHDRSQTICTGKR
jgi:hypothetical protein